MMRPGQSDLPLDHTRPRFPRGAHPDNWCIRPRQAPPTTPPEKTAIAARHRPVHDHTATKPGEKQFTLEPQSLLPPVVLRRPAGRLSGRDPLGKEVPNTGSWYFPMSLNGAHRCSANPERRSGVENAPAIGELARNCPSPSCTQAGCLRLQLSIRSSTRRSAPLQRTFRVPAAPSTTPSTVVSILSRYLPRATPRLSATCQFLPKTSPAIKPYCPYTTRTHPPTAATTSPGVAAARRLVARIRRKSEHAGDSGRSGDFPAAYTTRGYVRHICCAQLGYRATLRKTSRTLGQYVDEVFDSRKQVPDCRPRDRAPDFPSPANSFAVLSCRGFELPQMPQRTQEPEHSSAGPQVAARWPRGTCSQTAPTPRTARQLWAQVDRRLTDQAPWVPVFDESFSTGFVSARIGNYQDSPFYGPLLDQMWVRSSGPMRGSPVGLALHSSAAHGGAGLSVVVTVTPAE